MLENERRALPLGLTPKFLWIEYRLDDVNQAIQRYINAGVLPLQEWLDEKLELEAKVEMQHLKNKVHEFLNPTQPTPPEDEDGDW